MNIAIFSDTYPPFINGVSTSCYNLRETLVKHGHNVIVVTPRFDDGVLEYKDGIVRMPGVENKKLYGYRFPKMYDHKVMKILKDFKIDLIHYQTDSMLGIFARIVAKKLKIPLVYTYHTSYEDYTYYATHGFLDRLAKKTVRLYTKTIAKNCTEFITPSEKTKEFLRSTGCDIFINIVPTGIDFSLFDDDKVDIKRSEEFKKEHGIDKDTFVFLLLGRIAKEKSMDVSLKGYAKFLKVHPEIKSKMIVVGGGPQRPELDLLVEQLNIKDYVDFIGPVKASEVPFYYHLADIYTSASLTETQGLTFMEAMASGDIVLARMDDNLSGTIIDGETGFFFINEDNFVEKAYRIFMLKKEEKEQIKKNSLRIVEKYSIEKFYENIMEVYYRALRKFF